MGFRIVASAPCCAPRWRVWLGVIASCALLVAACDSNEDAAQSSPASESGGSATGSAERVGARHEGAAGGGAGTPVAGDAAREDRDPAVGRPRSDPAGGAQEVPGDAAATGAASAAAQGGGQSAQPDAAGGQPAEEFETELVDGRYPVRVIHPGKPIPSILREVRADDPELYAIEQGRRDVEEHDIPLEGTATSATELALMVLDALEFKDKAAMSRLRVTYQEFRDIIWPEFPESRPATGITAEHAWLLMSTDIASGALYGINTYGGEPIEFEGLSFDQGVVHYTNFDLYKGVVIHASLPDGQRVELRFVYTIVERNGIWKVYGYRDR